MPIIGKPVACFVAVMLFLSFFSLSRDALAEQEKRLLITGSSTMCPLIAETGRRFQSLHPGIRVDVECGGSERGIKDVREGKADIAMVSRALTEKEKDLYGIPIARDGVSIILHKNNPVKALSHAQTVGIFTGKIANWKKVGGADAPITVLLREKKKNVTELFNKYYKLNETETKGAVLVGDNPVTINGVASNPNAIGYISSGHAEREAASGAPIKILPVDDLLPTRRNIITGNYPVTRALSLVTRTAPSGVAREFIDYCLSPAVVDIVERFDFVPYED